MSETKTSKFGIWFRRLLFLITLCSVVLSGLYYRYVVVDPGTHLQRSEIVKIISQESPIYYRGYDPAVRATQQKAGVLFEDKHRIFVSYDKIPKDWVYAIIAAEDESFFSHFGLSIRGIARAMKMNIQAGRLVAGGSTLTQQTAKNLYYRKDRSLSSKAQEALNALRLEYHYSKTEILEFYANQIHVAANGRGLGIAAQYFFDKDVSSLSTLECAFLAGFVKGPANYNPFVSKSEDRRKKALQNAHRRTAYVLKRMHYIGHLNDKKYKALMQQVERQEIPFRKGKFQFSNSNLVDEISRQLSQEPFKSLFEQQGI